MEKGVKELPNQEKKTQQAVKLEAEGLESVNNFLVLTAEAEKQGIIDYRQAFHKLVQVLQSNLVPLDRVK